MQILHLSISVKTEESRFTALWMNGILYFFSTVISSSEREAAYVIDGLLHNDAVKSDSHSTVVLVKKGNWELKEVVRCQTTS